MPLGTTFELLPVLFALNGADPDVTFYIWGNLPLLLRRPNESRLEGG
jgi:hypothetical protein